MSEKLVSKTWEKSTWTKHARNIIEGLGKFPAHSKIIIIIRHSQRFEPKLVNENDLKDANMELVIFRFGWFGLSPDERWINYLGGFTFSIVEDHILLLDYGKLIKLGIPYWWNNIET